MQIDYVLGEATLDRRLPPFFFSYFYFPSPSTVTHGLRTCTSLVPLCQGPKARQAGRPSSSAALPSLAQQTANLYPITWASTSSRGRFEFRQRDTKSSMLTTCASHELVSASEAKAECIPEGTCTWTCQEELTVATADSSQPREGAPAVQDPVVVEDDRLSRPQLEPEFQFLASEDLPPLGCGKVPL